MRPHRSFIDVCVFSLSQVFLGQRSIWILVWSGLGALHMQWTQCCDPADPAAEECLGDSLWRQNVRGFGRRPHVAWDQGRRSRYLWRSLRRSSIPGLVFRLFPWKWPWLGISPIFRYTKKKHIFDYVSFIYNIPLNSILSHHFPIIVGSYVYIWIYFTCEETCFLQQDKLDDHETAGRNEAWVSSVASHRAGRGGSSFIAGGSNK